MKRLWVLITIICVAAGFGGCTTGVPVKEELTNYNDNSTVYMPVVRTGNAGLDKSVNERLKNEITANYESIKAGRQGETTEGFTAFMTGDLLSIFHEGYFEQEGNHDNGDSYMLTFHINIKNGTFYKLSDLFKEGYEDELTSRVSQVLDLNLGEYHMTYRPDLNAAPFDVFDNEIVFIFNPQTVAPKHLGFIDAALSFEQIGDLLNKDGEFYKVICRIDE